jgi:hypothetical protein
MFKIVGPGQIYTEDITSKYTAFSEYNNVKSVKKYFGICELTDKHNYYGYPAFRIYSVIKIDGTYESVVDEYVIDYIDTQNFLDNADFAYSIGEFNNKDEFIDKIMDSDNRLCVIHSISLLVCSFIFLFGLILL